MARVLTLVVLDSLRPKSGRPLSWMHYRILLQERKCEEIVKLALTS